MKLVIDANILFAALARNGLTSKLWFSKSLKLYAPEFIKKELSKYRETLRKKFRGSNEEFEKTEFLLLKQVQFVHDEELVPFVPAAASLITDKKDWIYLACALKEDAYIWTNDHGFFGQNRVQVKTTTALFHEIGGL